VTRRPSAGSWRRASTTSTPSRAPARWSRPTRSRPPRRPERRLRRPRRPAPSQRRAPRIPWVAAGSRAAGEDPGEPVDELVVVPVGEAWIKDFVDSASDVTP
jgi:hypothetical protein